MIVLRFLIFLPVVVLASPALLLLALIILVMDTEEGPLRRLLADEVRQFGFRKGFRRFMQQVFLPAYGHAVHSFVLGAAGFLVVVVGLRGLGTLPIELVYAALTVEFTMLLMWAVTEYFRAEEPITESDSVLQSQRGRPQEKEFGQPEVEKMVRALTETTAHLALLENRLRATESRFEQVAHLDGSLKELATKLDLLVSAQFNLRVRKEFEQIVAEMGSRVTDREKDNGTTR
jgi:hypothetical protein